MRLGEILVGMGKLTTEQVDRAREEQERRQPARRLGDILVEWGWIRESDLLEGLGRQFGMDVVATVGDEEIAPDLIERVPVDWARAHQVVPVRTPRGPAMLCCDPACAELEDDLSLLLGCPVIPLLAPKPVVLDTIERTYYQRPASTQSVLDQMPKQGDAAQTTRATDDLLRMPEQAPVTQLVNVILLEALKADASDIHLEPYQEMLKVRFRIDGYLYDQSSPPKHLEQALVSRLKVMGRLDIAEKRLPQDGMARVRVGEREIDIRISTVPVAEGERVVLRLLNRDSTLLPLSSLGMEVDMLARFRDLLRAQQGVILITGPTGSGKTTTLYAALRELDAGHANIMTIEDPIEYQLQGIGQIQVKPKIGLTFAHGLRHILRQDPDVILVGETRDLETAEIVIRASLTGHLVFTTLHTNDAASAVVRLRDMGVEEYLLSASLRAVLAQRLVRTLCPHCRVPAAVRGEQLGRLGAFAASMQGREVFEPRGCDHCMGGYRGRVGLYELLEVSEPMQRLIRQNAAADELQELSRREGMELLFEDGLRKVRAGVTSLQELLRVVRSGRQERGAP